MQTGALKSTFAIEKRLKAFQPASNIGDALQLAIPAINIIIASKKVISARNRIVLNKAKYPKPNRSCAL